MSAYGGVIDTLLKEIDRWRSVPYGSIIRSKDGDCPGWIYLGLVGEDIFDARLWFHTPDGLESFDLVRCMGKVVLETCDAQLSTSVV